MAALALAAAATAAPPSLRRAGGARDDGDASHEGAPPVEIMSHEEVEALHANFTRARELQGAPAGTVLTAGESHTVHLRRSRGSF